MGARAQTGQTGASTAQESFEIGLSTNRIGITSDFNGATLTVFGAIGNADMRILRQQRYDIVVALFGPRAPVVVREKERFFGIWLNRAQETIRDAPNTYSVASTRELRDITSAATLRRLQLGIDNLRIDGSTPTLGETEMTEADRTRFDKALRQIKTGDDLYVQAVGSVRYQAAESTLFRAELVLPPDLATGEHVVRAYLFREGAVVGQQRQILTVRKVGFQAQVDQFATRYAFLYGVFAVALAIVTGWLGRVIFKRD
ncbi:TIGR02186 family protein [Fulvimarina endophytica]|uniref:TIGR02186 family protein n=2 Tax=Fulvimarina endophytica TaxID=2293836 RepID=A0A371X3H7_9HYPH|nr:TIGR02186 family protein [Fulvimarina endophytica]